jgi:hypothetical protein
VHQIVHRETRIVLTVRALYVEGPHKRVDVVAFGKEDGVQHLQHGCLPYCMGDETHGLWVRVGVGSGVQGWGAGIADDLDCQLGWEAVKREISMALRACFRPATFE